MTDKLGEEIRRGDRAKAILEDGLLAEAFSELREQYSAMLFQTSPLDAVTREKLYLAHNVVGKVEEHFSAVLNNGRVARTQLERDLADEKRKAKAK